jgi:hypothetical protein
VNAIIDEYMAQGYKLTLRQAYYQMVARGLIPNTQRSYKQLGDVVSDGRLAGLIDWNAIEDRTRNLQSNSHWNSPSEIVEACARQFRVDLWERQQNYCEVLIEKSALEGIIEGICTKLDVAYMACRGYMSQSEMWGAAQRLIRQEDDGKETFIIHLGDHDPSGIDMTRDIQDRLELFESNVKVRRIALNFDQIEQYDPPPNPAKATDSRFEEYQALHGDESWELDALEPKVIVSLVEDAITDLIDQDLWDEAEERQKVAREQLTDVSERWDDVVENL